MLKSFILYCVQKLCDYSTQKCISCVWVDPPGLPVVATSCELDA